ncbi:MAG: ABC transporter ATP-binding protein [Deltaproteobacteria bacterium]|nr:ABC transporter ATP-binding protein [Deltaproteobacteria bacterium]MBW2025342.1 ABC transporter ATP-binding protein [Deltaproteobacteria bacterium]MBW2125209.1 ABC transporter ATP-binding protein [Deltaproteobacteria bacterium]
MRLLEVRNITKSFEGLVAVSNFSFSLTEGEIVGIIGPNGAGKTTIINMISGFCKPDGGCVIFKDKDITGWAPHLICKEGLARTFQICRPFPKLTVREHVLIGICPWSTNLKEAKKKADNILEITGLKEKRDVIGQNLSTPDRKLVEVARALATRPRVLLLDEPAAGLNATEVAGFLQFIERVAKEMKMSIVIVEHVLQVIMKLCQRVIVINFGEKLAEGTPIEIANNAEVISAYLGSEYDNNAS